MNPLTASLTPVTPLPAEAEELAARLARGEPEAFDLVVDRYGGRVVALARRLLGWGDGAEDVAQEVFVKLLERPTAFRREASLWTYVAAITVNRCRTLRRRRWMHDRLLGVFGSQRRVETETTPAPQLDEQAAEVRRAVAALPPAYREAVVLRYFEDLKISEVARLLGLKNNAVEARLSRARKLLAKSIGALADDEL